MSVCAEIQDMPNIAAAVSCYCCSFSGVHA